MQDDDISSTTVDEDSRDSGDSESGYGWLDGDSATTEEQERVEAVILPDDGEYIPVEVVGDPPSPDHPVCKKCKLWQTCKTPFHRSIHFRKGEAYYGVPRDHRQYTLIVGAQPDPKADAAGDLQAGDDFGWIAGLLDRYEGYLDKVWYVPAVLCRPAATDVRGEGRLTRTEITRCWAKHILPTVQANPPRAVIAVGPVAAFAVLKRMDAIGMERQWHRTPLGMCYSVRGTDDLELNPGKEFVQGFLSALLYGFEHDSGTIDHSIDYVVAKTRAEVEEWFEPVLAYFRQKVAEGFAPDPLRYTSTVPMEDVIPCSWDTETSSVNQLWRGRGVAGFRLVLWSFHHPAAESNLPLLIPTPDYTPDPISRSAEAEINEFLKAVMTDPTVRKVGHNSQYDENAVHYALGWKVEGFHADTMLMDFLLNSEEKRHALDLLCCRHLPNVPRYWEELETYMRTTPADLEAHGYARVPPEILYPYAAWDTLAVSLLYTKFLDRFRDHRLKQYGGWFMMSGKEDVTTLSMMDYCFRVRSIHHRMCTHMEQTGTTVDEDLVGMIRGHYTSIRDDRAVKLKSDASVREFEERILPNIVSRSSRSWKAFKSFGEPLKINWASVPQARAFFFDFLGLPVISRTKKQAPCLNAAAIHEYAHRHKVEPARLLGEWRKADKFVTSFLAPLLPGEKSVLRADGRIHPGYRSGSTSTGRLAVRGGYNMQAMPRDGAIKKIFRSPWKDGWMVTRDYSGIEVRLLAILSQDPSLCQAFRDGKDPHFVTQQFFFKDSADAKNKSQRSICKRALFGRLYGQGDQGLYDLLTSESILSPETGEPITKEECAHFNELIDMYYPGIAAWVGLAHEQGVGYKMCCSMFGFVRPLPGAKHFERKRDMARGKTWDELSGDKNYRRISAMVAEACRHSQNSPVQSAASDLTVMAAYLCQRRFEAAKLQATVVDIIHDDIWTAVGSAEMVPEVVAIMKDVMDNPKVWLPELLPGFDCSWINIPIIGETDIGFSPKDAFGVYRETSRGNPLEPGELSGPLLLSVPLETAETYDFEGVVDLGDKKASVPWDQNIAQIRETLSHKRLVLG